ncbi:hypothetical protein CJF32_00000865 [Rutstroemia sp. NJR-2017a WRK4]|nr:hypothetical protein CJF32_00000865 [Rutstroemia sp. NJR-2017a WRK4]
MVNTRHTRRDITPPRRSIYKEHSSRRRLRFYNIFDSRKAEDSIRSLIMRFGIIYSTAYDWIEQYKILGDNTYHYTRQLSNSLERYPRYSPKTYKRLVDPELNPVRDQVISYISREHDITLKTSKRNLLLKGQNYILQDESIGILKRISWSSTIMRRYILRSLNILRSLEEGKQRASIRYEKEVKPKGNAITQKYYIKHLLPIYYNTLQKLKAEEHGYPSD